MNAVAGRPIPILLYHSVDAVRTTAYGRWVVTPTRFRRHLRCLAANGYRPMTIAALSAAIAAKKPMPERAVAITFDDGLRDFRTGALPELERAGFPATLFVVAGLVGSSSKWMADLGEGDRPMMTWPELDEVRAAGIEIGAHTLTHPQLDILSEGAAFREILGSKRLLEQGIGRPVTSFAYPHGYASRKTRALTRRAGFTSACRVRGALSSVAEDPFARSRIVVTEGMGEPDLLALIDGRGLAVAPPTDRLVSTGWRMARRFTAAARAMAG